MKRQGQQQMNIKTIVLLQTTKTINTKHANSLRSLLIGCESP